MSFGVEDHHNGFRKDRGTVLEKQDAEGEIPVLEIPIDLGGTRVVPDTCNPV